jgi:hypothetical protein
VDAIAWVDAAQVEMVFHALAQLREGLEIEFGHQEKGGTGNEVVPIQH